MAEKNLYIGVDLNDKYALLSYFTETMTEPETVSTIAGSEIYQIPLSLYKKKGIGQWYFGQDAKNMAKAEGGACIDDLYRRAYETEKIEIEEKFYDTKDLLAVFFRKILMLPRRLSGEMKIASLGITVSDLNAKTTEMLREVMKKIGIEKEQFFMIDYKESFYYYALNQDKELWGHDVALFSYEEESLKEYYLHRNENTTPQMIDLIEEDYGKLNGDRDLEFTSIIKKAFMGKIVSSIFLVGAGFEGDWMKQSIQMLCRGRRAFLGKNLYSKGVCYAACVKAGIIPWEFVYIGDNKLQFNVSLKVRDGEKVAFYSLLSAGDSCYEETAECEVILDDAPRIDFWLQYPKSREAKIESLELTNLPKRENKTTRLRILLKPLSEEEVEVQIKDLGFGELYKSSDQVWKYRLRM